MKNTNAHLKSETKLIGGLLNFIFLSLILFSFSKTSLAFDDTHYYRKSFKLILKKDGRFFNNDTTFSTIKHGNYFVKKDSIFLTAIYSNDSLLKTEALKIVFQSNNKLSFQKGSKKISFHDKESSIHQSGASIQSV
jgi:hypothetical protein